jgi:hypothetical protein
MGSGMTEFTSATMQQIERKRRLIRRVQRKLLKIPAGASRLRLDYQGQAANELLVQQVESGKPVMICRLGQVELDAVLRFYNMQAGGSFWGKLEKYLFKEGGMFWWDDDIRSALSDHAGFFSTDEENLQRFGELMLRDIHGIDILGSWLPGEINLAHLFPDAYIIPLKDLEPYYHVNPWSRVLKGKRVLVIHPFEMSIRNQYARRELLFRDPEVLPEFELLTLKAVQSIAGNPTCFKDWFTALDWMCDQIARIDFDLAIIGAGAYGLPLAAYVKKLGRQGFHLGGATQILFGIRGSRWDNMPFFQQLYNEYWIRPSEEETPTSFRQSGEGYW